MTSFWTEKRDAIVLEKWPALSAAQIAERLGTTRNAVIGRLQRLRHKEFPCDRRERAVHKQKRLQRERAQREIQRQAIGHMKFLMGIGYGRNDAIAEAHKWGGSFRTIARHFGVSKQRIWQIVNKSIAKPRIGVMIREADRGRQKKERP